MKTACIALCAVLLLAGCQGSSPSDLRPPVSAQCGDRCFVPCVEEDGDTGIRWDGSPVEAEAWDRLASDVTVPLADRLRVCDQHRQDCVDCIERLKKSGVIQ